MIAERSIHAPETGGHVLLAVDTALGSSVALSGHGEIVECSSDDARGHVESIGTLIARVFERSAMKPEHVTAVVAGTGPGLFTGLRVGIAAARAFATGRNVPLLAVTSHEAIALEYLDERADARFRIVQDARRRELFASVYEGLDAAGLPRVVSAPHLIARADFAASPEDVWPERVSAARLAQLAARRIITGRDFPPVEALYMRQPDVAEPQAPKRVST